MKIVTLCKSMELQNIALPSRKHEPPPHCDRRCASGFCGRVYRNISATPSHSRPPTPTAIRTEPRRTQSRAGWYAADRGQREREPAGRLFSAGLRSSTLPPSWSPIFGRGKDFCAHASKAMQIAIKRERGPVKIFAVLPPFLMVQFFRTFAAVPGWSPLRALPHLINAVSIVNYQLSIINFADPQDSRKYNTLYIIYREEPKSERAEKRKKIHKTNEKRYW